MVPAVVYRSAFPVALTPLPLLQGLTRMASPVPSLSSCQCMLMYTVTGQLFLAGDICPLAEDLPSVALLVLA